MTCMCLKCLHILLLVLILILSKLSARSLFIEKPCGTTAKIVLVHKNDEMHRLRAILDKPMLVRFGSEANTVLKY